MGGFFKQTCQLEFMSSLGQEKDSRKNTHTHKKPENISITEEKLCKKWLCLIKSIKSRQLTCGDGDGRRVAVVVGGRDDPGTQKVKKQEKKTGSQD